MVYGGYWTRTSAIITSLTTSSIFSSSSSSVSPTLSSTSSPSFSSTTVTSGSTSSTITSSSTTIAPESSSTIIVSSSSTATTPDLASSTISTEMPWITSTAVITSLVTLTQFVYPTSGVPQVDILGPIEGLSECAQNIIFESLTASECNPANFPCICEELARLNVGFVVDNTCTSDETSQYDDFVRSICPNIQRVPPTVPTNPPPSTNISTTIVTINITSIPTPAPISTAPSTGISNLTSTPVGPFPNITDTRLPAPATTTEQVIVVPTTDAEGNPTVVPVAPTEAQPEMPDFTGAAASIEVPEFGALRAVFIAGAVGFMGLVFAEL